MGQDECFHKFNSVCVQNKTNYDQNDDDDDDDENSGMAGRVTSEICGRRARTK